MDMAQVSGVRLAQRQEEEIQRLVNTGVYVSASEFIREAVREKLASFDVLEMRQNVPPEQAKSEVLAYLGQHKRAYASDISAALTLDYDLVVAVLKELEAEGRVR